MRPVNGPVSNFVFPHGRSNPKSESLENRPAVLLFGEGSFILTNGGHPERGALMRVRDAARRDVRWGAWRKFEPKRKRITIQGRI